MSIAAKTGKVFQLAAFQASYACGYPLIAPQVLQVSITNRCNLTCAMCSVQKYKTRPGEEMSADELIRIITAAKCQFNIREMIITGGEPLLLTEVVLQAARFARKNNIGVILTTNGFTLQDSARQLVDAGVTHFHVSLDGTRDVHNRLRGNPESFDRAIGAIRLLSQIKSQNTRSFSIGIGTLILKDTIGQLYDLYLLGDSLGVDVFDLLPYLPDNTEFSLSRKTPHWPDEEDLRRFSAAHTRMRTLKTERVSLNAFFDNELVLKYYRRTLAPSDWKCLAGFKNFFITMSDPHRKGTFEPCLFLCKAHIPVREYDYDLKKIWYSQQAQQARREIRHCKAYCYQTCFSMPSLRTVLKGS